MVTRRGEVSRIISRLSSEILQRERRRTSSKVGEVIQREVEEVSRKRNKIHGGNMTLEQCFLYCFATHLKLFQSNITLGYFWHTADCAFVCVLYTYNILQSGKISVCCVFKSCLCPCLFGCNEQKQMSRPKNYNNKKNVIMKPM